MRISDWSSDVCSSDLDVERKMTAYHEAGHALVAHFSEHSDPVHRISIVSRGQALGFTLTPPEKDKLQTTQSELIDDIAVLMGGRSAEKLVFNELRSEEHTSELQSLMRISYAVFCLKKKKTTNKHK